MGFSSRELYLVLRARDEASRTLRGVSASILSTAAAAAAASSRTAAAYERERAASLRAQAQAARMHAAQLRERGATDAEVKAANDAARAYDAEARNASALAREHDKSAAAAANSAKQHEHLINSLHQAGVALQTIGVVTASAGLIILGVMASTIKVSTEYARQVALTRTQVDGFSASLQQLSDIGLKVANNVGVAFEQIQPELYDIFSSTSANLKQSTILLEGFAKAAVAGQVDMQSATRTTLSIMNAFHIPFEDVNKVLDIQFQLVRKGVGTYAQFAAVIGQVIPAAARAGQNFQTVAAMLAFLTRNGLSAASAAASSARALEALANPNTVTKLKALGVAFYDIHGQARPIVDVLSDIQAKLAKMSHPQQVAALTQLLKGSGGTIQARRFLDQVLLQPGSLAQFKEMLAAMDNSTGQFEQAYSQMADTTATKTQLLRNQFKTLEVFVGQTLTPAYSKLLSEGTKLLGQFNNLPPATRKVIVEAIAFGAILLTITGILITVIGIIAAVVAAVLAAGEALAIILGVAAAVGAAVFGVGAAFIWLRTHSSNVVPILQEVKRIFLEVRSTLIELYEKAKSYAETDLAPALRKLWDVINAKVLPILRQALSFIENTVIPRLREAGRVVVDLAQYGFLLLSWVITTFLIPAINTATQYWNEHKATIEPILKILAQLLKWFLIIAAIIIGVLALAVGGVLVASFVALGVTIMATIALFGLIVKAIAWMVGLIIKYLSDIVIGAALAFGWIPGLGPKLTKAAADFYNWAHDVNNAIGSILPNKTVTITVVANAAGSLAGMAAQLITGNIPHKVNVGPDVIKGAKAAGGRVNESGLYWVGENGPELRWLAKNDQIFTSQESKRMMNRGNAGTPTMVGAPQQPVVHKHYNITQNITTQEINPVKQAADLGWAVQAVL